MARYEFIYPSVDGSEDRMLDDLERVLGDIDIDVHHRHNIELVICEAFNNAMLHGNKLDPEKQVHLSLIVNTRILSADITDQGQGGLAQIRAHRQPGLLATHGRGLALMLHYARRVEFEETPEGHVRVSIEFELKQEEDKIRS